MGLFRKFCIDTSANPAAALEKAAALGWHEPTPAGPSTASARTITINGVQYILGLEAGQSSFAGLIVEARTCTLVAVGEPSSKIKADIASWAAVPRHTDFGDGLDNYWFNRAGERHVSVDVGLIDDTFPWDQTLFAMAGDFGGASGAFLLVPQGTLMMTPQGE